MQSDHSRTATTVAGLVATCLAGLAVAEPLGLGTYHEQVPAGWGVPSDTSGNPVVPRVTPEFTGPAPTNTWWSSLIWERYPGNDYGQPVHMHPLSVQAAAEGVYLGHVAEPFGYDRGYEFGFNGGSAAMTLGVSGLDAQEVRIADAGDWTVTAAWDDGEQSLRATMGRGLPTLLAECQGGDPFVYSANANELVDDGTTVVIEKNGNHWGLFAPSGFDWSREGDFWRCPGASAVSVSILPDADPATVALFKAGALVAVRDTLVSWNWEPASRTVRARYEFVTEPLDGTAADPLVCLYRHQWLHAATDTTGHVYPSPRGELRLASTSAFDVPFPVPAILPQLPLVDSIDETTAVDMLAESVSGGGSFTSDTYWGGKAMGRAAQLAMIADAVGDTAMRDQYVSDLKAALEDWFTVDEAGGTAGFAYNDTWSSLIGYPASYGADTELNDHHFHYGYFLWGASIVARFDPDWADDGAWGGMVDLLIRDAANWDRSDDRFCFLRGMEPYVGHSYASGHAGFAAGNNQESSSESMNFASGCILWGETTGRDDIRDLGLFLLAVESAAIDQYWFDVDEAVFPSVMPRDLAGIVWDAGVAYSTWWTGNPEEIHGINMLPITGGSLYLGNRPDAVSRLWDYFLSENGGPPTVWQDILWSYQAMADPQSALTNFATSSYASEAGDSKGRTYWWLAALSGLGQIDASVGGDAPLSAVFTDGTTRTYVAHNMASDDRSVRFTDGFVLCVPAGETITGNDSEPGPDCECGGDVTGDGSVGVDDLLAVIADWGNPFTVDDLLLVIQAWGTCD